MSLEKQLIIRYPNASRPWQHVLDCISGYLQLGERLITGDRNFSEAWNFGPKASDICTVQDLLKKLKKFWSEIEWSIDETENPHETNLLQLDCKKAEKYLNWQSTLSLDKSLEMTAQWYENFLNNKTVISRQQIYDYRSFALKKNAFWLENNENTIASN